MFTVADEYSNGITSLPLGYVYNIIPIGVLQFIKDKEWHSNEVVATQVH